MSSNKWLKGTPVSPKELLDSRTRRAQGQREMCEKGCMSLVSMTLNIPGPVKQFPLAKAAAESCMEELRRMFGTSILEQQLLHLHTGSEAMIRLDLPPEFVKEKLIQMEEFHPLGRLFDLDVLGQDGRAVSRKQMGKPPRACLLCGRDAKVCARSQAHSMRELQNRVGELLSSYFREESARVCAVCATRALLYEVSATPKPGLVDRANSGAHHDMDYFTFLDSSAALAPWFQRFFCAGWDLSGFPISQLFSQLRWIGCQAERDMFLATGGVNTHKGLIFALGVLCGALGYIRAESREPAILKRLCQICAELGQWSLHDFGLEQQDMLTYGEECFQKYQIAGARGSAASGFRLATEIGLPSLRYWTKKGLSLNDASAITLLALMAETEDTNMIHRGGLDLACACRKNAGKLLRTLNEENFRRILNKLDEEFIRQNLSPGGCADLLAISLMFWMLEQKGEIARL